MVILIKINVDSRRVENLLNNIKVKLPKEMGDSGHDLGKLMQRNLRLELTRQGLIWRRKLWNSIESRRVSKNKSVVVMAKYGIHLDNMRPHFVKLKRGRLIRRWAFDKGSDKVKGIAKSEGIIFVRPHPWIDRPLSRSLIRFPQILRNRVDKAMRESKQGG